MYTTEQKYKWLCDKLQIVHVDLWEQDALLEMPETIYFQFPITPSTVDDAVSTAMFDEYRSMGEHHE